MAPVSAHAWELDFTNEDDNGIWAWLDEAPDPAAATPGAVLPLADGEDSAMGEVVDLVAHDQGTIVHLRLLPRLFVDYMLVGHARRFTTPAWAEVRQHLRDGALVIVFGDDVPEAAARVLHVSPDSPDVEVELLP